MKTKNMVISLVSILLTVYMTLSGRACLIDDPMVVENFEKFGYSGSFRYFIGVCEIIGGIALLIPALTTLSSIGLIIIMVGACISHLVIQDGWYFLASLIFGFILTWLAYERRKEIPPINLF